YLESIWICNYVAAGVLLRECGALDDATARGVGQVADEAANLIGEFDEAFSNRQTWNNAALAAIAGWFEDDELARRAIEGPTGLLAHLMRGFGRDGMWYEGENYHLFALRGLLTGAAWAREAGVDVSAEQQLARRVQPLASRIPHPASRIPPLPVLVVSTLHAPRAPERRPGLVAGQRPARVPGARGVTDRRPVREPRVWPARRRARASGPPASHA